MAGHEEIFNTAKQYLAQWLETEIQQRTGLGRAFDTDDGLAISLNGHPLNDRWIDIDAGWVDATGVLQERPKVIRFELRELAVNRTQMNGICTIPLLDPFFERLWSRLLEVFRSSPADIRVRAAFTLTSTPGAFQYAAQQFAKELQSTYGYGGPFLTPAPPFGSPVDGPLTMQLYINTEGPNPHAPTSVASITARRASDGHVRLTVESPDLDWPIIAPWWEKLYAELNRRGLLASKIEASTTPERISADEAIRRFYRRKRYNPDLQLKDISKEFDISYAYLRKRKVAFDKRRKPRKGGNT